MKSHLIIPDPHTRPDFNNKRFDLVGKLIADLKPDVVINIGDHWDLNSLSSFEQGRAAYVGRNYSQDILAGHDAHERMFGPIRRRKRKMPHRIFIEGNHEHRLKRALNLQPQLEGDKHGISWRDLDLDYWYSQSVEYVGATPGILSVDGVHYSHYFISGVMGRPIGGEHLAYSLISKHFRSCTCGHIHTADFSRRTSVDGKPILGLAAGCFVGEPMEWAGEANKLWWNGVVFKPDVEDGNYNPHFISLKQLEKEYGR